MLYPGRELGWHCGCPCLARVWCIIVSDTRNHFIISGLAPALHSTADPPHPHLPCFDGDTRPAHFILFLGDIKRWVASLLPALFYVSESVPMIAADSEPRAGKLNPRADRAVISASQHKHSAPRNVKFGTPPPYIVIQAWYCLCSHMAAAPAQWRASTTVGILSGTRTLSPASVPCPPLTSGDMCHCTDPVLVTAVLRSDPRRFRSAEGSHKAATSDTAAATSPVTRAREKLASLFN